MTADIGALDYASSVLDLVVALLVTAGSLVVVRFYGRALRIAPRDRGLLLWHVVCVASGVSGVLVMKAFGQLAFLGIVDSPRWVRNVGYNLFELLIGAAIVIIALEQRRRVTKQAPETVVSRRDVTVFDGDDHTAPGGGHG